MLKTAGCVNPASNASICTCIYSHGVSNDFCVCDRGSLVCPVSLGFEFCAIEARGGEGPSFSELLLLELTNKMPLY